MQDEPEDPRIAGLKQDVVDLATVVAQLSQALGTALTIPVKGSSVQDRWQAASKDVLRQANTLARQIAERAAGR